MYNKIRFNKKFVKQTNGCWNWTAGLFNSGRVDILC